MSLLATHPNQVTESAPDLPGDDPTPAPLASANEVLATFFPSDAGGVGYLFDHGILDAAPTPLEDVPSNAPDAGAIAMSSVNEGAAADNAHVSGNNMPDIPSPVAGGATDVPLAEAGSVESSDAPAAVSTLRQTLVQEGNRLRSIIARLGGPTTGGAGG